MTHAAKTRGSQPDHSLYDFYGLQALSLKWFAFIPIVGSDHAFKCTFRLALGLKLLPHFCKVAQASLNAALTGLLLHTTVVCHRVK